MILSFNQFINEALSIGDAKHYSAILRSPETQQGLSNILKKISKVSGATVSRNGHRVYVPFDTAESYNESDLVTYNKLMNVLPTEVTITVSDYIAGLAQYKGRKTKIIKLLNLLVKKGEIVTDVKPLIREINTDPLRASKGVSELSIVFSKHPYDISGMSTDRDWTSCMNLYKGINKHYVRYDIEQGTFIAYLVNSTDLNIKNPIARLLIKPYINVITDRVHYVPEQKVYGISKPGFSESVNQIMSSVQDDKNLYLKLKNKLYCDSGSRTIRKNFNTEGLRKLFSKNHKNITISDKDLSYIFENERVFDWLITAKTENAVIKIIISNIIWENGTWQDGTWKNGIWKGGTWEDGAWEGGIWQDGTWKDGIWISGKWYGGTWEDGIWEWGTWQEGTWQGGVWQSGTWQGGKWYGGRWQGGKWYGGMWNTGKWEGGIWQSGTWQGGIWEDGTWRDGIWEDGTWKYGTWVRGYIKKDDGYIISITAPQ